MKKERPLITLWSIVFGSALVFGLVGFIDKKMHPDRDPCIPHLAHCEVHGGVEIMIEIEKPSEPEPVVIDPATGESCPNFDAMV